MTRLLCLDGDGIGPEIVAATRAVVDASGVHVTWEEEKVGFAAHKATGITVPQYVIDCARRVDGVVLGPVSHADYPPVEEGGLNPSGVLRKALRLFANIRPAKSYPGLTTPTGAKMDLVIFRENLEGFYADRNMVTGGSELLVTEDVAVSLRKITRDGSLRIARAAFEAAQTRRRQVTAIHKANVMRTTCGLFLECCREIAAAFPEVHYSELLVDAAAAHLVRDPAQFDVILTTNMFGDILSDLASELSGGLGLAGSLNRGADHAVAQAQHGSAPDLAGKNCANPTSMILSSAMLLAHLGKSDAAQSIQAAVQSCLASPKTRTADLGGALSTTEFTKAVISEIRP